MDLLNPASGNHTNLPAWILPSWHDTASALTRIQCWNSSCSAIRGIGCGVWRHQVDNHVWPKRETTMELIEKGNLEQEQQ